MLKCVKLLLQREGKIMGQKIIYNPADWDDEGEGEGEGESGDSFAEEFSDENSDSLLLSETVTGYEIFDDIDESVETLNSLADKQTAVADSEILAAISPQDKAVFNRHLEDLFELLELEQAADKAAGIKIYQTDSSPSRPWRFH